ncbi:aldehyde dehydrogenase [Solwaraspora sp. WMMB762]|uniref:aldehyde dehydrogenase n=1 Tax=Solwaraspora sp. WMMB762 TaxID=3404120 RepID=UPI003B9615D5
MAEPAETVRVHDRFYIDGRWVEPSSDAMIEVIDSATEEPFLRVAAAQQPDMDRAIAAARRAFDEGPWPRLSHGERADYLRKLATGIKARTEDFAGVWARETGVLYNFAVRIGAMAEHSLNGYADLAETFAFEEPGLPSMWGGSGMLIREPVGVVGAIYPWNGALEYIVHKAGPALLAGCTVVLKSPSQAPGEAYLVAEIADEIGLPPGVLNIVTADRTVGEQLVTDPRIDKITFTGSTAAGRRIAALGGQRVARVTLELGGKSAAVILDDADVAGAARSLAGIECFQSGQVCASLTRIIVPRSRHDEMVEAIAAVFREVRVGSPFDPQTQMGPLASAAQRERVEGYVAKGVASGATLAAGGGRPKELDRGWFVEPTVFGNVDNSSVIAQEEIFGPVLSVIPAQDEKDAVRLANDSIYGLNAAVFTPDTDRALAVARQLRSGTVGQNGFKPDFGIAFGGFKQSGIGREGVREGIRAYLETKTVILGDAVAIG